VGKDVAMPGDLGTPGSPSRGARVRAFVVSLAAALAVVGIGVGSVATSRSHPDSTDAPVGTRSGTQSDNPFLTDDFDEQKRQMLDPWERDEDPEVLFPKPDPDAARPSPEPEPPYPTGIFEDREAPFATAEFMAVNRWQGVLDGARYTVYAGNAGYDRMRTGRLHCVVFDDSWNIIRSRAIDVAHSGSLRITGREGTDLLVAADSGRRLVLDIPTLSIR